jgi:hypothetical protein
MESNEVTMNISIDLTQNIRPTAYSIRPVGNVNGSSIPNTIGFTISLSAEAQKLGDAAISADATENSRKTAELKSYINGIDFNNASASQMTELAFKLFHSGELSLEQAAGLVSMEADTEPPISASKKINMVDHLNMMHDVVAKAAKDDATLNSGVDYSKQVIATFDAIRTFATSDRQHIL